MKKTTILLPAVLAGLAWAPVAAAQELTEEAVQAIVEAPAFQASYQACYTKAVGVAEVDLVIIINDKGGAALSKVDPQLPPDIVTCIGIAVAKLVFPSVGQAYEITYPLTVPAAAAVAPAPVAPVVQPQPAYPVVVAQPYVQPQPVYQDESWRIIYNAGRSKIIGGAVMLGIGGVVFLLPGIILVGAGSALVGTWSDDLAVPYMAAGGVMLTLGIVFMAVGGAKIGRGKSLQRKALQMRGPVAAALIPELALAPLPGGGAMSLTWHF